MTFLFSILFLFSSANGDTLSLRPQKYAIAVLDFSNESRQGGSLIGKHITERLTFHLLSSGKYILVDRGEILNVLEKEKITSVDALSKEEIERIGKSLNVDFLISGTLIEYKEGDIESKKQRIGLLVKLLRVEDGSLVAIENFRKKSGKDLISLTEEAVSKIAKRITARLMKFGKELKKEKKAQL